MNLEEQPKILGKAQEERELLAELANSMPVKLNRETLLVELYRRYRALDQLSST